MSKPVLILPNPKNKGFYYSWDRGAFRGMARMWAKEGLVEIKRSDNPYCWLNRIGDVLLYDRPTLEFLNPDMDYQLGLFGNPDPPVNGKVNSYWTFWPMIPSRQELFARSLLSYDQRDIRLIWIGSYENHVQRGFRPVKWWSGATDFCSYGPRKEYTHNQYLRITRRARYGLCLRGYGPKCCRDMELMSLGVVPVFTNGCSLSYYNRLQEGTHYFYAGTPSDAYRITSETTREQWERMSNSCLEWYRNNVSTPGSFNTTMEIINRFHP